MRPEQVSALVENHRAVLRYLERRLGNHAVAEGLLQEAFVRTLDKAGSLPVEATVPWFYRVLRNAAVDHQRRLAVADRGLGTLARELDPVSVPSSDLHAEVCACVVSLAGTLKPEYAEVLRVVDVDGTPVKDFASASGLTATNAGVRLHRARQALRRRVAESCGTCAEHGCLDCSCGKPGNRPV